MREMSETDCHSSSRMRRSKSWNLGSERTLSRNGSTLSQTKLEC